MRNDWQQSVYRVAAVGALALFLASPVAATTVITSALKNGFGDFDTFVCMVRNSGNKATPSDVTIELVGFSGSTIASAGPLSLLPGDPRTLIWISAEDVAYCRVTGTFSKRKTLITFCSSDTSGTCERGTVLTSP